MRDRNLPEEIEWPFITELTSALFRLNNENFTLFLQPFIVLFCALALFILLTDAINELFWYIWVTLWLLLITCACYIMLGLLYPHYVLMSQMGKSHYILEIIRIITPFLIIVFAIVAAILIHKKTKKLKQKQ